MANDPRLGCLLALSLVAVAQAAEGDHGSQTEKLAEELHRGLMALKVPRLPEDVSKHLAQPDIAHKLAQWRLFTATGPKNLDALSKRKGGAAFLKWLTDRREAMESYLASGPFPEGTGRGLEIWSEIWNMDPDSREGLPLRLAVATALAHLEPVLAQSDGKPLDPIACYRHFKANRKSMLPSFERATVRDLRYVVGTWVRDDELTWARKTLAPKLRTQEKVGEAPFGTVEYREVNKDGVSVDEGLKFYGGNPMTLARIKECGGVCGAISRYGVAFAQAHGIPAMPVGQPGHCAFLVKTGDREWRIFNDLWGWGNSGQHSGCLVPWGEKAAYILVMERVHARPGAFLSSERCRWAALMCRTKEPTLTRIALRASTLDAPLNLGAWQLRIQTMLDRKPEPPPAEWDNLEATIRRIFADAPLPLVDLLERADARRKEIRCVALVESVASGNAARQKGTGEAAVKARVQAWLKSIGGGADELLGKEPEKKWRGLDSARKRSVLAAFDAVGKATGPRADLDGFFVDLIRKLAGSDASIRKQAMETLEHLAKERIKGEDKEASRQFYRKLILFAASTENLPAMERFTALCLSLPKK